MLPFRTHLFSTPRPRFVHKVADSSQHLHLIPRSAPSYELPGTGGTLEVNALGYAGQLLVKSEEQNSALDEVAKEKDGLTNILLKCGVDRKYGEEALTQDATQHGGAGSALELL